jgi:hypothetical protein
VGRQLHAAGNSQFLVHAIQIILYRVRAEFHSFGNFAVPQSFGDQISDFCFAAGQKSRAGGAQRLEGPARACRMISSSFGPAHIWP